MNKREEALDFIYETKTGKRKTLNEAEKRTLMKPEHPKENSYFHIALNIFKSVYPFGFPDEDSGLKKLNQLRGRIWNRVKQFAYKQGLTEEQVQNEIMNPNSDLGKEILRKIDVNAKLVGLNGQLVPGWTGEYADQLWKPTESGSREISTNQKEIEISPGDQPFGKEDIEGVTGFITKVIKTAKDAGILSQLPTEQLPGVDISDPEFAYSSAVKYLIQALAFQAADIATRGLIEYDVINFDKEEDETDTLSDKKFQTYVKGEFAPIMDKIRELFSTQKSGIRLLDDTLNKYQREIIKIADQALTDSGFDDELPEEIEFFSKMMNQPDKKPYLYSEKAKKAIDQTTDQISQMLSNDQQFVQSITDNVMNKKEIQKALVDADPELAKKIADIESRTSRVDDREKIAASKRLALKQELFSRLDALAAKGFSHAEIIKQELRKPGLNDQLLDNIAVKIEDVERDYGIDPPSEPPVQGESFRSFYER